MPSINFKGKNAVWNHHLSVPYQILEKDKKLSRKGKNEDENLIIEADNLIALKSLLPKYQGEIKCIYIDPPYNTGNEGWAFNDKVNSPLIKEWLKQGPVGTEDLTRHDKWLCMMTPRLKLLRELLSDDGVIFISIDDNEAHHLKQLLDEIFEEDHFLGNITWINRTKPKNIGKSKYALQQNTEYILVYSREKKDDFAGFVLPKTHEKKYPFEKSSRKYRIEEVQQRKNLGSMQRNSMVYKLLGISPKENYRWQLSPETRDVLLAEKKLIKKGKRIYQIIYKDEEENTAYEPFWSHREDTGTAESAKEYLEQLLNCDEVFDNVKPVELLKQIFSFFPNDCFILDSFAGSGTTADAVLQLNKQKDHNRKFILVQLPEKIKKDKPAYKAGFRYIHEITRERVKRVIKKDKLGVGFSYMKLGPKIDEDSILSGELPTYKEFAKYVYYLATGATMDNKKTIDEEKYFVGKTKSESIYLIYKKDREALKNLALTLDWAEKTNKIDKGKKIVYAPACFLDEEGLEKFNISFVGIPYNLFERK